jgi:hypothetical protein
MLLVVIGVVAGWVLARFAGFLDARRAARAGARAIFLELGTTEMELRRFRQNGIWGGAPGGPRRHAWETHSGNLLLIAPEQDVFYFARTYMQLDRVTAIIDLARGAEGEESTAIAETLSGEQAVGIDAQIAGIQEATRRLSNLAIPKWRWLLIDLKAKRTPRRRAGLERLMVAVAQKREERIAEPRVHTETDG